MSQLIQIADFQFVALKDSIDITEQDMEKFASTPLNDEYFSPRVIEVPTSLALISEFEKCPFANTDFRNDLDKETPFITKTKDYVYIAPSYSVKNAQIPLLLQKAGLKIKRTKLVAYLAHGTNPKEPYILVNQDGTPFETPEKNSNGHTNNLTIDVYDDVLALRPEEYEKYLQVKILMDAGRFAEVDKQDLYLWALANTFVTRREKLDIVFHEMKHAQNSLIFFDYLFNNPNCKLSGIDIFKYYQDNELSAKLAEAIAAINAYNQSENKRDLSVFESSYILQQLLQDKNADERKKLLSDMPYIVSEVCMYWYKNYAINYKPQFIQNTLVSMDQIPLKHLAYETDGTSYNDIRKSMFTYSVYDAKTGKYINMDLSEYVIDFGTSKSDLKMTQQIYQDKVIERQKVLDNRKDKIHYALIKEAQQKYKELVKGTEYYKTLMELQSKGIDYMSALNFIPRPTDTTERPTYTKSSKAPEPCISEPNPEKKQKRDIFHNIIHKIKRGFLLRQLWKGSDTGINHVK